MPAGVKRRLYSNGNMNKEEYAFYKSNGICTHCRKARAEPGITLCLDCKIKNRKYKKAYNSDKQRKIDKEKREFRKANSLCVNCGCRPQQHGLLCGRCYTTVLRRKERMDSIPRSERASYGLCYTCGKNPVLSGKKVCKDCHETRLSAINKCLKGRQDGFNSNWKKQSKLIFNN